MNFNPKIAAAIIKALNQFPNEALEDADISPNAAVDLTAQELLQSLAESHYEAEHGELPEDFNSRDYINTLQ